MIPSSTDAENKELMVSVNNKIPDITICITNTKHNATNQSRRDSLYFALSAAVELIKILIAKYTKTDNNPTTAIFLNDLYHDAIVSCKLVSPSGSC